MRAGEIAEPYPVVSLGVSALAAARLMAQGRLPGLVVTELDGRPKAVLPAWEVVRFMVPDYIQADPNLAGVVGDVSIERLAERLAKVSVGELLPATPMELPVMRSDDTVVELAAVMARLRSPLCAVVEDREIIGVVTASHLLELVCGGQSS